MMMFTVPAKCVLDGCVSALLACALLSASPRGFAQQPAPLPPVNLGDTSFLDAIAAPGVLTEITGQGVHEGRTYDPNGTRVAMPTDVHSGSGLVHIAWLSNRKVLGGWYGAEVVLTGAYVDTGAHGTRWGFGDFTFGPIILQWPKHQLFGKPFYQRAVLDVSAPLGQYSSKSSVNIGTHSWNINPYYAFTFMPTKKLETSWRTHFLWNSVDSSPPARLRFRSTQAGQAIHFNATAAYEVAPHLYIGANAYYLAQITDARANDLRLPHSREQIGAIGPGVVFQHKKVFYYVNGYHEVGAKNKVAGNKLVLRVEKVF